jgi:DNA-directed RNA polymerase specialized sigma24 family protein
MIRDFYYEELTHEEIADKHGLSVASVKSELSRARGELKKLAGELGDLLKDVADKPNDEN